MFAGGMSASGTALGCWAQTENSLQKAEKLASIVGCSSDDVQSMVDCLRARPAHQIVQAVGEFGVCGSHTDFSICKLLTVVITVLERRSWRSIRTSDREGSR